MTTRPVASSTSAVAFTSLKIRPSLWSVVGPAEEVEVDRVHALELHRRDGVPAALRDGDRHRGERLLLVPGDGRRLDPHVVKPLAQVVPLHLAGGALDIGEPKERIARPQGAGPLEVEERQELPGRHALEPLEADLVQVGARPFVDGEDDLLRLDPKRHTPVRVPALAQLPLHRVGRIGGVGGKPALAERFELAPCGGAQGPVANPVVADEHDFGAGLRLLRGLARRAGGRGQGDEQRRTPHLKRILQMRPPL
jgi:hypothetical protein